MKDKSTKKQSQKKIYKKWWFWIIIVVILAAISGTNGAKDDISSAEQQTSDKFIEEVKTAIQGTINNEDEAIADVVLKEGDLCVTVDLSKANPTPITMEDLANSRTGSITDAILELADYDSQWETITVDFGNIGKITNSKNGIKEHEAGGRYFPSENFTIK